MSKQQPRRMRVRITGGPHTWQVAQIWPDGVPWTRSEDVTVFTVTGPRKEAEDLRDLLRLEERARLAGEHNGIEKAQRQEGQEEQEAQTATAG